MPSRVFAASAIVASSFGQTPARARSSQPASLGLPTSNLPYLCFYSLHGWCSSHLAMGGFRSRVSSFAGFFCTRFATRAYIHTTATFSTFSFSAALASLFLVYGGSVRSVYSRDTVLRLPYLRDAYIPATSSTAIGRGSCFPAFRLLRLIPKRTNELLCSLLCGVAWRGVVVIYMPLPKVPSGRVCYGWL